MSHRHTPGPWNSVPTLDYSATAHRVITGGPDGLPHIAYIPKNAYAAVEPEALANGQLLAAAPRMLAALEEIASLQDTFDSDSFETLCQKSESIALTAIVEAIGEDPAQIDAELAAAGIDMGPANKRLREMVDAAKAKQEAEPNG